MIVTPCDVCKSKPTVYTIEIPSYVSSMTMYRFNCKCNRQTSFYESYTKAANAWNTLMKREIKSRKTEESTYAES